jgi:DNA-(apurinic or apyrimidinic site) lyase
MNQKITDKTIVFAVKMFGYAGRNIFGYVEYYPDILLLPIDSRLRKLFEIYGSGEQNIEEYYRNLSKQLNISPLHLDSLLWVNYDKLVK